MLPNHQKNIKNKNVFTDQIPFPESWIHYPRRLGGQGHGGWYDRGFGFSMPWRINTTKDNLIGYKLYPRSNFILPIFAHYVKAPPGLLPIPQIQVGTVQIQIKREHMIHVPPKSGYHSLSWAEHPIVMISPLCFKARFIQVLPIFPQYIINITGSLTFHHCLVSCWNQHCWTSSIVDSQSFRITLW